MATAATSDRGAAASPGLAAAVLRLRGTRRRAAAGRRLARARPAPSSADVAVTSGCAVRVAVVGVGAVGARRRPVSCCRRRPRSSVVLRDERAERLDDAWPSRSATGGRSTGRLRPSRSTSTSWSWPARPARTSSRRADPSAAGSPSCRASDDVDEVGRCSTSTPRPASAGCRSWSAPASRPGLSCVLAAPRRRAASTRSTRSTWPRSAPAVRRAPASTTEPLGGTRARLARRRLGRGVRPAPGGSCAGSPIRSAAGTATGPRCPTPLLLVPAFPGVPRVTARVAATRRDRLRARLPMLWPTHPEGGPGRDPGRGPWSARRRAATSSCSASMDRPAVARRCGGRADRAVRDRSGRLAPLGRRRAGRAGRAGRRSSAELRAPGRPGRGLRARRRSRPSEPVGPPTSVPRGRRRVRSGCAASIAAPSCVWSRAT